MAQDIFSAGSRLQIEPSRETSIDVCVLGSIPDQNPLISVVGIQVFIIVGAEVEMHESYKCIAHSNDKNAREKSRVSHS